MKDGSSLVVTHSSIPISATRGPDADLSFEESEDILEDPDDEPILGRRISKSDEEEGASPETFMGMCFLPSLPFFFSSFFFLLSSLFPFCLHVHFSYLQSPLRG